MWKLRGGKDLWKSLAVLSCIFAINTPVFALANPETQTVLFGVEVGQVNVDVRGVELAVQSLNAQLQLLTEVINAAQATSNTISDADRLLMSDSIRQINTNAAAVTVILQGLPQQIDDFNRQLPKMIQSSKEPLANLQHSLMMLNETSLRLKSDFPDLLNEGQLAINESVDDFLIRLALMLGLILLLVFALIGFSLWMLNKKIIQPVGNIVEVTSRFPEQQQLTAEILDKVSERLVVLNYQLEAEGDKDAEVMKANADSAAENNIAANYI